MTIDEEWERYRIEQSKVPGMPGLRAQPCFMAGYRAAAGDSALLLALCSVHASCVTFASRDPNDTTAVAIRDYLQKIVDQYE